jgi:hypothetical protein
MSRDATRWRRLAGVLALVGASACGIGLGGLLPPPGPDAGGSLAPNEQAGLGGGSAASEDAIALDFGAGADDGSGGSTDDGPASLVDGSTEGSATGRCDFAGTWATKLLIPVSWVPQGIMGVILNPGSGAIGQWILQTRVQSGTTLTDTAVVCGIDLPDFQGTLAAGSETYGVRFPDSLFDNNHLPPFTLTGTLSSSTSNATYTTTVAAALLGIDLPSPTTAPWPAWSDPFPDEADSDMDGNPGVTAFAAQGAQYSTFPTDIYKSNRASSLFLVIRQVTQVSGTVTDCDHISGSVTIPQIVDASGNSKYAIDSHVLGCGLQNDGGTCDYLQANFLDSTQPIFSPSGGSSFQSRRMQAGATCAQVRQVLP